MSSVTVRSIPEANTMGFADCAIAAIARANGFALATRNLRDFKGAGGQLMNPWEFTGQ